MTKELKTIVIKYMKGLLWLLIHQKTGKPADIDKVILTLNLMEEDLRKNGVKDATIEELSQRADKLIATPVSNMTREQQLIIGKLIYGQKTEWSPNKTPA